MSKNLKIRPYARLITMLGDQLIKNEIIALVELIKNSYDADASWVKVSFVDFNEDFSVKPTSKIVIEDDGCGMDEKILEKHWLNPATPDKLKRKSERTLTDKKRIMQGEKGIGRFAIFKLGKNIKIISRRQKQIEEEVQLQTVIEGERYIRYSSQPLQAYTGDLIKDGKNYYLNIRAQCDLARPNQQGEYNPTLYCVKGKKLKNKDIATDDIKITQDGKLSFGVGKEYTFDELKNICTDIEKLKKVNNKFRNHRNGIFFNKGDLLGKRPEIIIACIAGENAIKFDLKEIIPLPYKEYVDRRIGRLLPPYITKVQQNSSQYIVREGLMPVPEELYSDFGASDC